MKMYTWQQECLKAWEENGCRGIAHVVTGAGKTVLALEAIQEPVSLFDPVYQSGGDAIYVMDQVQDRRVSEDEWVRSLSIDQALDRLPDRDRTIIRQRYFQGRTQMEVAREIGISQAQVSRLEKAALQQMRKYI